MGCMKLLNNPMSVISYIPFNLSTADINSGFNNLQQKLSMVNNRMVSVIP